MHKMSNTNTGAECGQRHSAPGVQDQVNTAFVMVSRVLLIFILSRLIPLSHRRRWIDINVRMLFVSCSPWVWLVPVFDLTAFWHSGLEFNTGITSSKPFKRPSKRTSEMGGLLALLNAYYKHLF